MNILLNGLIIFILLISTNKLTYLYGCNLNKILNNIVILELITILVIFYFIHIFNNKGLEQHIYISILLWILIKLFSKLDLSFTIIAFIIIFYIFFDKLKHVEKIEEKVNKNEENKENYKDNKSLLQEITNLNKMEKLLIVIIIVGFIINLNKKHKQFGKKFNILKFIFNKKCNYKYAN